MKLGEGDVESARKGVGNAIALVTVVSILLMAVFLLFLTPVLDLFGATDTLRPFALEYGFVIGVGLPFMMIPATLNSLIRADGSPKYAMFSMVLGAIINTVFDPIFIFVFHMGVRGAAIATVMGQVGSFIVSVVYMPRFKSLRLRRSDFRLRARTCRNVAAFGISSFITQFAITIVMALTNNLLAVHGAVSVYGAEIPLTATGIVMKVNQILISILVGIAVGAQPIIGFNYGARDFTALAHLRRKGLATAVGAGLVCSLLCLAGREMLPVLFGAGKDTVPAAAGALWYLVVSYPLVGLARFVCSYFCAVSQARAAALLAYGEPLVIQPFFLFLLPAAGLGLQGVWAAYPATALVIGAAAAGLLRRSIAQDR